MNANYEREKIIVECRWNSRTWTTKMVQSNGMVAYRLLHWHISKLYLKFDFEIIKILKVIKKKLQRLLWLFHELEHLSHSFEFCHVQKLFRRIKAKALFAKWYDTFTIHTLTQTRTNRNENVLIQTNKSYRN